jgi:feruloyl-CoA synthase
VAQVRLAVIEALAPLVLEAVIAGHDREALGALVFVTPAARELSADALADRLGVALAAYNAAHPHSSERVARVVIASEPLSLDEGETTDKGYTNQRRVLERRATVIAELLAELPGPGVVCCE